MNPINKSLTPDLPKLLTLALVSGLFALNSAQAALITYVDADLVNTVATDGDPAGTGWQVASDNTDGLWESRVFGNGGSIFEAQGDPTSAVNVGIDHEALTTTVTGLIPGLPYNAFVYFWSNPTDTWEIDAGLAAGSLTEFTPSNSPAADASDFDLAPLVVEGARTLYQGFIGVGIADASGNLSIFIDDGDTDRSTNSAAFRSWYDGVGVQVVPEPSTVILITLGGLLGLVLLRRRK